MYDRKRAEAWGMTGLRRKPMPKAPGETHAGHRLRAA